MSTTFAQLGVPDAVIERLRARGITTPFEIQAATIADSLNGRDVCGRAPTGSGKTLAFGIPLVIETPRADKRRPRSLVLAPTRELADQIGDELRTFAGDTRIGVIYGGVGYKPQLRALNNGVDILIACPGRLEDLIDQGALTLADVDRVVLDEADRMADMGFIPAVRRLLDQTAAKRQTVLFSATLDGDVAKLTRDYQRDPVRHEVGEETPDITSASHVFWKAARADRRQLTGDAINAVWPAIVFTRTRHGADRLAKQLGKDGVKAAAIHGGRSQNQRTRALNDFAKNKVHALIATDVAARGIHVDGVALVLHFDPPEDHKTYIHRSGRTARAGEGGVVLSLVQPDQVRDTRKTQRKVGLDEPMQDSDPGALRDLSPSPGERPIFVADDTGNDERPPRRREDGDRRPANRRDGQRHRGASKTRSGDRNRSGQRAGKSSKPRHRDDDGTEERDDRRPAATSRPGDKPSAARSGSPRPKNGSQKRRKPAGGGANKGGPKSGPARTGSKRANGAKRAGGNAGNGTGKGAAHPNRKARRAHLQPGNNG